MQKYILILALLFTKLTNVIANDQFNIFSTEEQIIQNNEINDPFEKYNRKIYSFNLFIDKYSTKPLAKFYQKATSKTVRSSVSNFFSNLYMPVTIINSLLQLDFANTAYASRNLIINSTIGVAGLFDPAEQNFKLAKAKKADFSQTLATYNVGTGPYLMLPFLGPSSLRNFTGDIIDMPLNPLWHDYNNSFNKKKYLLNLTNITNNRAKLLNIVDDIEKNSLDPYSVVKSAYAQRRIKMVNNEPN